MAMYPAYRLADVLDEYASTFYALLSEGYRIKNRNYEMLAVISDLPGADKDIRQKFYKNLEYASKHPGDILKTGNTGATPNEIKRLLGGR